MTTISAAMSSHTQPLKLKSTTMFAVYNIENHSFSFESKKPESVKIITSHKSDYRDNGEERPTCFWFQLPESGPFSVDVVHHNDDDFCHVIPNLTIKESIEEVLTYYEELNQEDLERIESTTTETGFVLKKIITVDPYDDDDFIRYEFTRM